MILLTANYIYDYDGCERAIDFVHDSIEALLYSGSLDVINDMLGAVDAKHYHLDIILAALTVTLPDKSRLSNRQRFFEQAKEFLKPELLHGLE